MLNGPTDLDELRLLISSSTSEVLVQEKGKNCDIMICLEISKMKYRYRISNI